MRKCIIALGKHCIAAGSYLSLDSHSSVSSRPLYIIASADAMAVLRVAGLSVDGAEQLVEGASVLLCDLLSLYYDRAIRFEEGKEVRTLVRNPSSTGVTTQLCWVVRIHRPEREPRHESSNHHRRKKAPRPRA